MRRFIAWLNRTAPNGKEPLPAITRAGTAHLYFESIYPFEDGNGRIGRAITEKAMTQSFVQRVLVSLATTILAHQKKYYEALERANRKALLRMFREGPEGLKGGLSAGNYSTITGASPATTTRDLADLVENGTLTRTVERKHARYTLNLNED